jgi:hypothetical protein
MTMIAKITEPVTSVALDGAFAAVPRKLAPSASPRRPVAPSVAPDGPSLVIVVPDPVDAIVEVGKEARSQRRLEAALDALRPVAAGCLNRRRPD